jgi:hypothetical protein
VSLTITNLLIYFTLLKSCVTDTFMFRCYVYRKLGGLPPRNRIYKGHKDIATKDLHRFEKALMPLKMYLKSLVILEKA